MKKFIIAGIFLFFGLMFVFDPFNWWPIENLVGKPCTPENVSPRCTGKINFF
tara:strand:+ start:178 stop:333 length:156 start_codon:yes stop_codon:yes gene_type:complete